MYTFGKRSEENITGVHPALIRVVRRAMSMQVMDFSIIEGFRTDERQEKLYDQGRTTKGAIVTWTLNSRHKMQPSGYGEAFDLTPYPIDWEDENKFWMLRGVMLAAAAIEKVEIEYLSGGRDLPHVQLKRKREV